MDDLINIEYKEGIKINTFNLSVVFNKEQLPLKFNFVRSVNKNKIWGTELKDNSWATFPDNEMVDVIIFDKLGNLVYEKKWDVLMNGTFIYKKLRRIYAANSIGLIRKVKCSGGFHIRF